MIARRFDATEPWPHCHATAVLSIISFDVEATERAVSPSFRFSRSRAFYICKNAIFCRDSEDFITMLNSHVIKQGILSGLFKVPYRSGAVLTPIFFRISAIYGIFTRTKSTHPKTCQLQQKQLFQYGFCWVLRFPATLAIPVWLSDTSAWGCAPLRCA